MKSLKNIVKRCPSPKTTARQHDQEPLMSQRNKNSSQNLYRKYHQTIFPETKESIISSKYRIVTEPIDDRMAQISKSYSKLAATKPRDSRIEVRQTSIKHKQKSSSGQKRGYPTQNPCPYCKIYQNELLTLKEQISSVMTLKESWKQGDFITDEFQKQSAKLLDFSKDRDVQALIQNVSRHILDLMRDIDALTEIDLSKLITLTTKEQIKAEYDYDQEDNIKSLFNQLREELNGKITSYDFQGQYHRQSENLTIRALRAKLSKYLRQNLALKTKIKLLRRDGRSMDGDIERAVMEVVRGLK